MVIAYATNEGPDQPTHLDVQAEHGLLCSPVFSVEIPFCVGIKVLIGLYSCAGLSGASTMTSLICIQNTVICTQRAHNVETRSIQ